MAGKSAVILLVEDDDAHAALITRVMEEEETVSKIYRVSDGEEVLDYLFHKGCYAKEEDSPRPDLVLLDLRLPKLDGHEVLTAIKQSDDLKVIPVVVLTTSENERDIAQAYRSHANSYLVKPLGFREFSEMVQEISSYWLVQNRQPQKG
ncbi:MAG TPA: response regulator [Desulfobacteria bacterium]|nr:response regulator [Desulfobacteria bacterium]